MSDTVLTPPKRKTTADYQAAVARPLAAMNRLEEQIEEHHAESERLKAETGVIKARTAVTLSRLQDQMTSLSRAT
jgi:hypothetical protein